MRRLIIHKTGPHYSPSSCDCCRRMVTRSWIHVDWRWASRSRRLKKGTKSLLDRLSGFDYTIFLRWCFARHGGDGQERAVRGCSSHGMHEYSDFAECCHVVQCRTLIIVGLSYSSFTTPRWDERLGLYYLHLTILLSTNTIQKEYAVTVSGDVGYDWEQGEEQVNSTDLLCK